MQADCEEFLANPGKDEINKQHLKSVLEDHRLDMLLQTSELLDDVNEVDNTYLKRIYNYNLATNRNNYEAMLEVRKEYLGRNDEPEKLKMWGDILKSDTIAMKQKRIREDRVKKIYFDKM